MSAYPHSGTDAPAPEAKPIHWSSLRSRPRGQGKQYWRSLEEAAQTPEFRALVEREFPAGASEWQGSVSRRDFLMLVSSSVLLAGLAGCTRQPIEQILPYVQQPSELTLGEPLTFATALPLSGFGVGMVVQSREGRPIKADGNRLHPASLGGSDVWLQTSIYGLYDPDRAKAILHYGKASTGPALVAALHQALQAQQQREGAGLRFLTGNVTSPTLAAQLKALLEKYPQAKWHQYEPINRDNALEGARLAFGEYVAPQYQLHKAAVIISLDSDFLYVHPMRLQHARAFTDQRRVAAPDQVLMNRLYVVEGTPSVTGSMADYRLSLTPSHIEDVGRELARLLGIKVEGPAVHLPEHVAQWVKRAAKDLETHRGQCLVLAGEPQPPEVHALEHLLNHALGNVGNTVVYTASPEARPVNQLESLRDLVEDMKAGRVELLVILGGNPVFDAPADFAFAEALRQVKSAVHLSTAVNETSVYCEWHVPKVHFLESWSDIRAYDGTVTILQPLIAPLFGGQSAHELLGSMLNLEPRRSAYEIVREFWRASGLWPDFEAGWRAALHDGLVPGTGLEPRKVELRLSSLPPKFKASEFVGQLEAIFRPDPNLWDGRFANNAWLQEIPKPLTKLTWDNAVIISPALAQKLDLQIGQMVRIRFRGREMEAPVWILPGQAERAVTFHLGHGRSKAGRVGTGTGFNFYRLRTSDAFWAGPGLELVRTGESYPLVSTQTHFNISTLEERQVFFAGTLPEFLKDPHFVKKKAESPAPHHTLYNPEQYEYPTYKWGMAIDLTTCIGCNACIAACNIENNIPTVGKQQVGANREMLWLRVDTYYHGTLDNPDFRHMPVPCMHCENAPCEYVCPTEATVHDHEGLNLQVYNRCIGTRYCSNNCPYKVRRFNFFNYQEASPLKSLMHNPEVTVRWRGVMEKCTYCIQRISSARIKAKQAGLPIPDGAVRTACQEACPAEAIVFGDMNDLNSQVSKYKDHPLEYPMLGQLAVRPRTTYLAKLENREESKQG